MVSSATGGAGTRRIPATLVCSSFDFGGGVEVYIGSTSNAVLNRIFTGCDRSNILDDALSAGLASDMSDPDISLTGVPGRGPFSRRGEKISETVGLEDL